MHLKLHEIKTHIRNIFITITKSLKSVADIVSSKVTSLSTKNQHRFTILEKQIELSELNVKRTFEQRFLENEDRLKNVETTVNEIAKSQDSLTELLQNFIEDAKKREDST
ncbi:hypothetical protein Dimus_001017, partial [Dionaea muscipula]